MVDGGRPEGPDSSLRHVNPHVSSHQLRLRGPTDLPVSVTSSLTRYLYGSSPGTVGVLLGPSTVLRRTTFRDPELSSRVDKNHVVGGRVEG